MTDTIEKDSRSDRSFPVIIKCSDIESSDILIKYKHQPTLEKRLEQLKMNIMLCLSSLRMWRG